jgi:hypothetical protein
VISDNHPDLGRGAFTSAFARRAWSTNGRPRGNCCGRRQHGPDGRGGTQSRGADARLSFRTRRRHRYRRRGIAWRCVFFLHADSTLPPGALDRINQVLSTNAKIIDGNFRLVFDGDTNFGRRLTRFCALLRLLGFYYGDCGIFVRRSVYQALGGFRPMPVMEDWDFVRRLERLVVLKIRRSSHRHGVSKGDIHWRSSTGGSGSMRSLGSAYHPIGWSKCTESKRCHGRPGSRGFISGSAAAV